MRLDKLLVERKYGSRKEMQTAIRKGLVQVNDVVVKDPSTHIDHLHDYVVFNGLVVAMKSVVTLMMNKPQNYVCANKDGLHKTVFDLLQEPYTRYDLNIAGRLDIDTEGLIILTNDGDYLHSIISPKKDVYKTYFVRTKMPFHNPEILNSTYQILDGRNQPYTPMESNVEVVNETDFYLSIKEGKYHQVKRMVAHFGNEVVYLKRIRIGDIVLDETLGLGEYKEL